MEKRPTYFLKNFEADQFKRPKFDPATLDNIGTGLATCRDQAGARGGHHLGRPRQEHAHRRGGQLALHRPEHLDVVGPRRVDAGQELLGLHNLLGGVVFCQQRQKFGGLLQINKPKMVSALKTTFRLRGAS